MKSTISPGEGNTVKVSVTIEEAELEPSIDNAWKEIAKEVRIPGFRNGKVPRKVLEARVDPLYARSEALRDAVSDYYSAAIREHDVDVIAQPIQPALYSTKTKCRFGWRSSTPLVASRVVMRGAIDCVVSRLLTDAPGPR